MRSRQRLTCALLCTFWVTLGGVRLAAGTTGGAFSTVLSVISVAAGCAGLVGAAWGYLASRRVRP